MYLLGCMLYLSLITLILYRFTFFPLTTNMLTPPYWINMGAVAISTLAGALLAESAESSPLLAPPVCNARKQNQAPQTESHSS